MNMQVRFESRHEIAEDVWEYRFSCDAPIDFVAGQYAKFWFADDTSLGGRTFTLTSRPGDATAAFVVRFPNPMSEYKQKLQTMPVGTLLRYEQPMGDAILPRDTATPLVFIAQGIGIASYIAILRECHEQKLPFTINIFWTRRASDKPLQSTFEQYLTDKTKLHVFDSQNRLHAKDVLSVTTENTLAYISGSQHFVEHLGQRLETQGMLRERMIYDYYEGYETL